MLNEVELFRKMFVIIVYKEGHADNLILSIRSLTNLSEELSKLTINLNIIYLCDSSTQQI